jgi:hypothetical protein
MIGCRFIIQLNGKRCLRKELGIIGICKIGGNIAL